jgi:chlorite dismutase
VSQPSNAPETLEGWFALHDIRLFDRTAWHALDEAARRDIADEAQAFFAEAAEVADAAEGASGLYTVLGHKGDLLILHLRPHLSELEALEQRLSRLAIARYLIPSDSFVSVIELSQHGAAARSDGQSISSPEMEAFIKRRLKPQLPEMNHICFYPMNKRRGEQDNWFTLDAAARATLMRSHGETGRRYAGKVVQMITGAMGLDDWEWGVTLFADDPLQFKKLVYEMRFDEVSARYAEFGSFYVGQRLDAASLVQDFLS